MAAPSPKLPKDDKSKPKQRPTIEITDLSASDRTTKPEPGVHAQQQRNSGTEENLISSMEDDSGQDDNTEEEPLDQTTATVLSYWKELTKATPNFKKELSCNGIKKSFVGFWTHFFRHVWYFYVEALFIPAYRPEWGKFRRWTFRLKPKPHLNPYQLREKAEFHRKKQLLRYIRKVGGPGIVHNSYDCGIVTINIAGYQYQTQLRTLKQFPNTLLGDPQRRIRYFDPKRNEYFFDRHRSSFEAILYYYQSGGVLNRPTGIPFKVFENELRFFQLGVDVMKAYLEKEGIFQEDEKPLPKNLYFRKIWLLVEYPESSDQARIVSMISIFIITYSVFLFCIETIPAFNQPFDVREIARPGVLDSFFLCETICIIWFITELFLRFLSSPNKLDFARNVLNIIDLVAILPYFLQFLAFGVSEVDEAAPIAGKTSSPGATLSAFRVVRLVRVFRIFKLSRHSKGLQILGKTLKASMRELGLLIFFLIIGIILFSSAIYFAEFNEPVRVFTSIPHAFWWGIITMTTIGYGDLVPVGFVGRIVGALCAIGGVLTIALPVPVIVANFNYFYTRESDVFTQQGGDKSNHVEECPFRPTCGSPATTIHHEQLDHVHKRGSISKENSLTRIAGSRPRQKSQIIGTDGGAPPTPSQAAPAPDGQRQSAVQKRMIL